MLGINELGVIGVVFESFLLFFLFISRVEKGEMVQLFLEVEEFSINSVKVDAHWCSEKCGSLKELCGWKRRV